MYSKQQKNVTFFVAVAFSMAGTVCHAHLHAIQLMMTMTILYMKKNTVQMMTMAILYNVHEEEYSIDDDNDNTVHEEEYSR